MPAPDTVGAPSGAGGYQDVAEPVAESVLGGDLALPVHLDVGVVTQLAQPVVDDAPPGSQPGKACLPAHPPPEFAPALGDHTPVATLPHSPARPQPGGP